MEKPTIAILGASTDRRKFGNKAVRAYEQRGYEVFPVNPRAEEVEGIRTYHSLSDVPVGTLDRISVYLPPKVGITMLDEIKQAGATEIWFNPGSESPELIDEAEVKDIEIINACSIVDIGLSPSQFPDE